MFLGVGISRDFSYLGPKPFAARTNLSYLVLDNRTGLPRKMRLRSSNQLGNRKTRTCRDLEKRWNSLALQAFLGSQGTSARNVARICCWILEAPEQVGSRPDWGADTLLLWRNAHDFATYCGLESGFHPPAVGERFLGAQMVLERFAVLGHSAKGVGESRSVRKPRQCRQRIRALRREFHFLSAQLALSGQLVFRLGCEAFAPLVTGYQLAGASEVLDDGSILHTSLRDRVPDLAWNGLGRHAPHGRELPRSENASRNRMLPGWQRWVNIDRRCV